MIALTASLLLLAPASVPQDPAPDHPLCKDATGMKWVLPFSQARAAAAERKRLLMIKPVAFGTSRDGGW